MNNYEKMRWFMAGVFSTLFLLLVAYFVLIMPLERSIEVSLKNIVAQRDAAMAENAKLRRQLAVMDGQPNSYHEFTDPVTQ